MKPREVMTIEVTRKDGKAWFDVGAFSSEVATMPQPDGSLAFMSVRTQPGPRERTWRCEV